MPQPKQIYVPPKRQSMTKRKSSGIRLLVLRICRRLFIVVIVDVIMVVGKLKGIIVVIMRATFLVVERGMVKLALILCVAFALLLHRNADIASGFVAESKVFFEAAVVLDPEENDGCGY